MPVLEAGNIGEKFNLTIRQGATFGPLLFAMTDADNVPIDLTGAVIRGQIRKNVNDVTPTATLVCAITDAPNGKYEVSLSAAVTAAIKCGKDLTSVDSKYVWDLELLGSDGVTVIPLYYGTVSVFREITR